MRVLLLALILVSQIAQATTCTPRNFITEENSPFQKIPVYDQDGIAICYAYVTSQLVDYNLIKRGATGRTAHPVWLALTNAWEVSATEKKERLEISLGTVQQTIQSLSNYQNCPYNVVESAIADWAKKAKVSDSELINFLEVYTKKFRPFYDAKRAMAILESKTPSVDDIDILTLIQETKSDAALKYCSSNATWDQLLPHLRAISVITAPNMISKLLLPACENAKSQISVPPAKLHQFKTTNDVITGEISAKIDELNAPVAVSYCAKALKDPSFRGLIARKQFVFPKDCDHHESLIVGKRQAGNSCQLLLRNTWGSNFGDWTKNKKCLCKHRQTGAYVDDCSSTTHNNGQYTVEACWVDEDLMNKNATQMTSLEDNPQ